MDKAKQNYKIGQVRIVSAEQIKMEYGRSISYEEKRFFCSNCGEYVSYVHRNKGKTFFRHIKKNEETMECELRINTQKELSIYQKVGLPIYLKKDLNGNFNLAIGFYPIDENIIEISQREQFSITISGIKDAYNFKRMYYIDNKNLGYA